MEILREQLELGVPLDSAALLAGYEPEDLDALKEDEVVSKIISIAQANLISYHLDNIKRKSKWSSNDSKWLLEKVLPKIFSGKVLNDEGKEELIVRVINGAEIL